MLVAVHSDTWLYAVAFYNGARLDKGGRYHMQSAKDCSFRALFFIESVLSLQGETFRLDQRSANLLRDCVW